MVLSIIIPTLNEAEILGETLASLDDQPAELIIVDGGSKDHTVQVARQWTPRVLMSPSGRGLQQDMGARQSNGDVLLFLHADTTLPSGYQQLIHEALVNRGVVFGAFRLGIHPPTPPLNVIAFGANLRSRLLKIPYGDQAIFIRRAAYFQVGGFQHWPLMEDVDLVRRLKRIGGFRLSQGSVRTSARRWQQENPVRATLRNYSLVIRFTLGISPHALSRHYPESR